MGKPRTWLDVEIARGRVTRRDFMKFCSAMAGVLALPSVFGSRIAHAVESGAKPTLVWLNFQDCTGNTESLLRASRPTVGDLILDVLSVDYHETIMAAAGHRAEEALHNTVQSLSGQYLAVVEGSIPLADDGIYCVIGGRAAIDIAREVCGNAAATVAIGTCAAYGGIPAARPNPTGAVGVSEAVPNATVVNLPACPANVENLTALVVYYLTLGRLPPLDAYKRPLFAYGKSIHDNCERRAHYDAGQYVEAWGDEGHRKGHCLYKMGCKGPVTYQNCPDVRWNSRTNWPIGCGHPCVGCAEPDFWDKMTPFYEHLSGFPGFGVASDIDSVGLAATGVVAAAATVHGVAKVARTAMAGEEKPITRDETVDTAPDQGGEG